MTSHVFLRKQVKASTREERTRGAIRALVLGAVDTGLRAEYGENYSNRCAQSAAAVARLLRRCGVNSVVVVGEACVGQVIGERRVWATFGGQLGRFHCWTITQFGELVDLTVRQHHLAPGVEPGGACCPALWWDDAGQMPSAFLYLPRQRGVEVRLADADESAQFARFLRRVALAFDDLLDGHSFGTAFDVVASIKDLQRLAETGDPWARAAAIFGQLPPPEWAQLRLHELFDGR